MIARYRVSPPDESVWLRALRRGSLARGPYRKELAEALVQATGYRHALFAANTFSILSLSLRAMLPGHDRPRVAVPAAATCLAMVHAVRAMGGTPVYVDLLPESASASVELVSRAFAAGQVDGALVPRHFGLASGASALQAIGIPFVDDAAQSVLSVLADVAAPVRSGNVALSLYPTKMLAGIDGGVLLTNDGTLAEAVERLTSYADLDADDGTTRFNASLPDLHAAIALDSLERLPARRARLASIVARYDETLRGQPWGRLRGAGGVAEPQRYVVDLGPQRDWFVSRCAELGIESTPELGFCAPDGRYDVATRLVAQTCSIPLHADLTDDEVDRVCDGMRTIFGELR
jgi:dTDP-4-amino-4,6-dideoxygalactose transaminase